MKIGFKDILYRDIKIIFLLSLSGLLLVTSCSRRALPGSQTGDIRKPEKSGVKIERPAQTKDADEEITTAPLRTTESRPENAERTINSAADLAVINLKNAAEARKLHAFWEKGIERSIYTGNARPADIIETSRKYIGVPHCMGGTSKRCIDCSGLLLTVFAQHGIGLPHNSEEQARYGRLISGIDQLVKGDLVFFTRSYNTPRFITHSGIYIGNNQFIHTSSRRGVTITSLSDPWWNEKFVFGTRLFNE
jgi:murein DD-endopeptidase / murein LD-carboxypeptidase